MPIYEYRCPECQQVFEEWVKHAEEESACHPCPVCHSPAKRLMSHTSFALKGTGWYATDYGSHKSESGAAHHKDTALNATESKSSGADAASSGGGTPPAPADAKSATQPAP